MPEPASSTRLFGDCWLELSSGQQHRYMMHDETGSGNVVWYSTQQAKRGSVSRAAWDANPEPLDEQ